MDCWQYHKSAVECNRHMLESGLAADVTFLVSCHDNGCSYDAEVKRFKAHKYILISRSPVFYSMLCGLLPETGEIRITDVNPDAFTQMLNYIYTDQLELTPEQVTFILHASKKYLLPGLTHMCTEYLEKNLDESNACVILDIALTFDEPDLVEKCLKLIIHDTSSCFRTESFLSIGKKTLSVILQCERFSINELEVLECCLKWAVSRVLEAKDRVKQLYLDDENTKKPSKLNHAEFIDGDSLHKAFGDCIRKFRLPYLDMDALAEMVNNNMENLTTPHNETQAYRDIALKLTAKTGNSIDASGDDKRFDTRCKTAPYEIIYQNITTNTKAILNQDLLQLQELPTTSVKIHMECSRGIMLKSLIVGTTLPLTCSFYHNRRTFQQLCRTNLQSVQYGDQVVKGFPQKQLEDLDSKNSGDCKLQEWRVYSELELKKGSSLLVLNYVNDFDAIGGQSAKGNVHVLNPRETIDGNQVCDTVGDNVRSLTLTDECLVMKLQIDRSWMPILGLRYSFV